MLGRELWESKFDGLLRLIKEYIVDVWKIRKHKFYDSDSGSGLQLHSQPSLGERNGKVHLDSFTSNYGCVVDGVYGSNMSTIFITSP